MEKTEVSKRLRDITLDIRLSKKNGKNIRLHIPASLVRICVEKRLEPSMILGNSWLVKNLDLADILRRVEQGERGRIWFASSKAGDTLEVEVF